jgi:hyperosmotically inducible protein
MPVKRHLVLVFATLATLAGCGRAPSTELAGMPSRLDPAAARTPAAAPPEPAASAPSPLLPPAEALTDPVITAQIRARLQIDPAMDGADVSVNTDRGVVTLTGLVASQEQAAVASAHAQRQDGVVRVDNHLAVNLR